MHMDPAMPVLVSIVLGLVVMAAASRLIRQPLVIGYIAAGVVLGPAVFGVLENQTVIERIGTIGVVLLMFFVGMEVSPQKLRSNWRVALIGTGLQIVLTVAVISAIGAYLGWPARRGVLLGCVIAISSTAVVIKLLEDWNELNTPAGQDTLSVLLAQDIAIVPMMIVLTMLGGQGVQASTLLLQLAGGGFLIGLTMWAVKHQGFRLPFGDILRKDHELQLLYALLICLGLALISGLLHLSAALGAFVAGMVLHATRDTHWVEESLNSFRILFIALFFVSVGMLVNLHYLLGNWREIALLVAIVVFGNTILNASIIRWLGRNWRDSLYTGALLSQVGEFGFVLAAVGLENKLITRQDYLTTLSVIIFSLLISPFWIALVKRLVYGAGHPKRKTAKRA